MHWIWERWELWQSLKLDLSSSSKLELLWGTAAKLIEVSQLAGDLILPPATAGAAPRLRDGDNPSPGRSPDDIMHRKAFQGEDHRCQAGPPDLWHGVVGHALLPELPAVQSVAFPRRRPAGPASSLLGFTPAQKKTHPTSKPLIPPVTIQRSTESSLFGDGREIPAQQLKNPAVPEIKKNFCMWKSFFKLPMQALLRKCTSNSSLMSLTFRKSYVLNHFLLGNK